MRDAKKRKNAREEFRVKTDAEVVGEELDRAQRILRDLAAKLVPAHAAEMDERERPTLTDASEAATEEALHHLGRVKGAMYLERIAKGMSADDLEKGSGWKAHTIRQFENREADAMVSSLFRYAAGLRAAGVKGRLELRWVHEREEAA